MDGIFDDSFIDASPVVNNLLIDIGIDLNTPECTVLRAYAFSLIRSFDGQITPLELSQSIIAYNDGYQSGWKAALVKFHRLMGFKGDTITRNLAKVG